RFSKDQVIGTELASHSRSEMVPRPLFLPSARRRVLAMKSYASKLPTLRSSSRWSILWNPQLSHPTRRRQLFFLSRSTRLGSLHGSRKSVVRHRPACDRDYTQPVNPSS